MWSTLKEKMNKGSILSVNYSGSNSILLNDSLSVEDDILSVESEQKIHDENYKQNSEMIDTSTPCSIAPTVVRESYPLGREPKPNLTNFSLALQFSNLVPTDLSTLDLEFYKLWIILKERGWTYVAGDLEFNNFYLAPGVTDKKKAKLFIEKFGSADDLLNFVVERKDTTFKSTLQEYFRKHPQVLWPKDMGIYDMEFDSLWPILKEHGWKRYTASPHAKYIYGQDGVTKEEAIQSLYTKKEKDCENKKNPIAFTTSQNVVSHILKNQTNYIAVLSEYFSRNPIRGNSSINSPESNTVTSENMLDVVGNEKECSDDNENELINHSKNVNYPTKVKSPDNRVLTQSSSIQTLSDRNNPVINDTSEEEFSTKTLFNFLWPILRKNGWTYSRGNLLHSFAFLRPSIKRKIDGKEGRDYFEGDEALMQYVEKKMPILFNLSKEYLTLTKNEDKIPVDDFQNISFDPDEVDSIFNFVWFALKEIGWTHTSGNMFHSWAFLRPGVSSKKDSIHQKDYFYGEAELSLHIRDYYPWIIKLYFHKKQIENQDKLDTNKSISVHENESDNYNNRKKVEHSQKGDNKKEIFQKSARLCGLNLSTEPQITNLRKNNQKINEEIRFNQIWPKLQTMGWKYFPGDGLVSWLYAKPHVSSKREGKLGIDMFSSENDVVKYYLMMKNNMISNDLESDDYDFYDKQIVDSVCLKNKHFSSCEFANFAWGILKSEYGWIYKSGAGLNSFCFLKPPITRKRNGIEGVNMFSSYDSLCDYVRINHLEIVNMFIQRKNQTKIIKIEDDNSSRKRSFISKSESIKKKRNSPLKLAPIEISSNSSSSIKVKSNIDSENKALFDFVWGKLQKDHGWKIGFVQVDSDGKTQKNVLLERESLLQYVCEYESSLILEYAKQQKAED